MAPDAQTLAVSAPQLPACHWPLTDAGDANGQRLDTLFANGGKPLTTDVADGPFPVSGVESVMLLENIHFGPIYC